MKCRRPGKIDWTKFLLFQPYWSFCRNTAFNFLGQKYLLFRINKEVFIIYSHKNFHGTLENHAKCKSLAQWTFPCLCYVNVCLSVMFIILQLCIAMCGRMHVYKCVLVYTSSIILLHFKCPTTCTVAENLGGRKLWRTYHLPNFILP